MTKVQKIVVTPVTPKLTGFRLENLVSWIVENPSLNLADVIEADPMSKNVVRYGASKYRTELAESNLSPTLEGLVKLADIALIAKIKKVQSGIRKPSFLEKLSMLISDLGDFGEGTIMVSHEDMLDRGFPVSSVKYTAYWSLVKEGEEPKENANSGTKSLFAYNANCKDGNWIFENTSPTKKNEPIVGDDLIILTFVPTA